MMTWKLTPQEFWIYAHHRLDFLRRRYRLTEERAIITMAERDGVSLERLRRRRT